MHARLICAGKKTYSLTSKIQLGYKTTSHIRMLPKSRPATRNKSCTFIPAPRRFCLWRAIPRTRGSNMHTFTTQRKQEHYAWHRSHSQRLCPATAHCYRPWQHLSPFQIQCGNSSICKQAGLLTPPLRVSWVGDTPGRSVESTSAVPIPHPQRDF